MPSSANDRSTAVGLPAATDAATLAGAVEARETQGFFDACDAAYAALRDDPAAGADYQREAELLERATVADGLSDWPSRAGVRAATDRPADR
jgi:hypothetical protein